MYLLDKHGECGLFFFLFTKRETKGTHLFGFLRENDTTQLGNVACTAMSKIYCYDNI